MVCLSAGPKQAVRARCVGSPFGIAYHGCMSAETVRVRFAPSPTGFLHVGGARTALFNWLFARKQGGVFLLRIEDTDVDRSKPELVEAVIEGIRWLGLDWDEGPYYQSQRYELYRAVGERLKESGRAYPCFCSPEELAERRKLAEKEGRPPGYDGRCRRLPPDEVTRRLEKGERHATRFAVPEDGVTGFDDLVFGRVEVANDEIEDFVLFRGDGHPTYHQGVVADDVDMGITHVIRGADHISNTHKQVLLYEALGEKAPVFAHVPLILGPDRTRMSKRHGATSVTVYAEEGFLPEAFRNFLALLGWSPGDDTELMHTEELIRRFSLEQVSRTNAVFDRTKLEWFNSEYLRNDPLDKVLPHVERELRRAGLWDDAYAGERKEWFAAAVDLLRPRVRLLTDFTTWACAFFSDDFDYDPAAVKKFLTKDERLPEWLGECRANLEQVSDWSHDPIEQAVRSVAENHGIKAGVLINAIRVGLTGQRVAPPLFNTMEILGRERVLARLAKLLDRFADVVAAIS